MSLASLWVDTTSTLEKVIWGIFIGSAIAAVMLWYTKGYIGRVARRLMRKEIYSEDKAVSLKELEMDKLFIRRALKNKYSALRKVVYCTLDKEKLKKVDFYEAKFYIPEQLKHRAYFKYDGRNINIFLVIIFIIAMFIIANLCVVYIPELLEMME